MKLLNVGSAVAYCLKSLKFSGFRWSNLIYVNKGRYCVVFGEPNIGIVFKRSGVFMSYANICDGSGVGDSINSKSLEEFCDLKVKIVYTVHEDGKIYASSLRRWLEGKEWVQKEGTKVKSIPIKEYVRIETPMRK